jgi:hypothetical protein
VKVVYRKLGKERAWGQAHIHDNTIEVDPRLKGKKKLEIIIHEALHILNPDFSESKVIEQSKKLTNLLWKEHFRQVDNAIKV